MNDIASRLQRIEQKVLSLYSENIKLQDQNQQLRTELAEYKINLDNQKSQIVDLEEKNKIVKLAASVGDKDQTDDIKKIINGILSEIDSCINLIEN